MRSLALLLTGLVASCAFDTSTLSGNGAIPTDADPNQPDADPNQPDANPSLPDANPNQPDADPNQPDADPTLNCTDLLEQPIFFDCEDIDFEAEALVLDTSNYSYNTDTGILSDPQGVIAHTNPVGRMDIIVTNRFELGTGRTLRVTGNAPLIIVAWEDILITGTIDLSSSVGDPGAGANPVTCATSGTGEDGASNVEGGGGAGGGGFGGRGGDGGDGEIDGAGGQGGVRLGVIPTQLRGGCPGGVGGFGDGPDGGGNAGHGGGAIHLAARVSIIVEGQIHAGGNGGQPSRGDRSGGGGGGSGGMIGLESPSVELRSLSDLAANGGGGGGGTNQQTAQPGVDGRLSEDSVAPGGAGEGGRTGGIGGILDDPDGGDGVSTDDRGAGGGGGGVGYIWVRATNFEDNARILSPDPIRIAQ